MGKHVLTPKLKRTEQENIPTKTEKKIKDWEGTIDVHQPAIYKNVADIVKF